MKFDVFVSFRGIDTRRTFVSHLLLSLSKKRITTYEHEEEILENQSPSSDSSQLLQAIKKSKLAIAIKDSKVAIVVISKNYATSSCCLDELVKIINCKEKGTLEVVPVFYEVDPPDVLKQVDHRDTNLETMKKWRDALEKLNEIYHQKYSYWEDEDSYSYIIDQVLIHVSHCLSKSELRIDEEESQYRETCGDISLNEEESQFSEACNDISISLNEEEIGYEQEYYREEMSRTFACPITSLCSLQCLSAIVTKGIELVAARVDRFIYGEESNGVKPRHPWSFLDVQNDNYVTSNNLSLLVLSNDIKSFVGMNRHMKEMYTLLDLESRDKILEIGISGERGVGKTTLARCVYEQISPQFQDHHYFINDTKNCSTGGCLLEDIARASLTEESESLDEVVKAKLRHRKVLLIVDSIFDIRHIKNIRNIACRFGPGSRTIFVTHHKSLLLLYGVERCYVVDSLRYDEALQLFSQFAFKKEHVPREYYKLSVRAVTVTGCIPLALKVFGTFLRGKHVSKWEHEQCRLETSQSTWDCVAEVSSYIRRALS